MSGIVRPFFFPLVALALSACSGETPSTAPPGPQSASRAAGVQSLARAPLQAPAQPASVDDVPPSGATLNLHGLALGKANPAAVKAFLAMRTHENPAPVSQTFQEHAGQGFYMVVNTKPVFGAYVNHTMYPNLREPGSPNSTGGFLYAPTMFGPGKDCIEATTLFQNAEPQIWAWDWCKANANNNPSQVVTVDSTFANDYIRTMNDGLPEFTVETVLGRDGKTWNMALYDYTTKKWTVIYQTSGKRDSTVQQFGTEGWDFFETYTDVTNNQSDVCQSFGGQPIASDGISIAFDKGAKHFTKLNTAYGQSLQFGDFYCPQFSFSVPSPDSFWEMTYQ